MKKAPSGDFPRQEHVDLVDRIAREVVANRPGLRYIDTIPSSGTHRRDYEVGIQKHEGNFVKRIPVPFVLAETSDEARIRSLIDTLLDQMFPETEPT